MDTSKYLKTLRISKGLTQKELAEKVGTTQTTITNIENGITKYPSIEIAIKIAEALEESVYNLFGFSSSASGNSTSFVRLPLNNEKESKFSILVNYIQSELSMATLLIELSSNQKLSEEERSSYRMQKESLQDGVFNTFKTYKKSGVVDCNEIKKLIELYPGFTMWQNFLAPLRKLID